MRTGIVGSVIAVVVGLFVFFALSPFAVVGAGQRGVVTRFGAVSDKILTEGFHIINPLDRVIIMNVRTQKEQVEAQAATKDLQNVESTIALNFHVDPTRVAQIYQKIGEEYSYSVIAPAIQESVKASTAKYTAEELIIRREAVRDDIKVALREKLEPLGMIIDEFNIVNFSFSEAFNYAIEAKVTAEQTALAAKNKLEQVKFEAEQKVVAAKAEAESIRIQAQAIQQQGGDNYVQLQAIEKWDGKLPQQYVPGSAMPFLNLK